jgi:hypothetical protein
MHVALDIKAPPAGTSGFVPIRPLVGSSTLAQLGRWQRLVGLRLVWHTSS